MLARATIQLLAGLATRSTRAQAAAELAAAFGAEHLFLLVEDPEVDALLPAPGLRQTFGNGPLWRAFLAQCREPGTHCGVVPHPATGASTPAVAYNAAGTVLLFLGERCEPVSLEPIFDALPLLAASLRNEHAAAVAAGELTVARADARLTAELARSLDAARADLERQAKSLRDARGRAEQATRAKDEFLAMLGHELRNPLAPIMTALQMMRLRGNDSREQDILERQVARVMRLVDDLLDVSRIASGKVELRQKRVELATITARAVEAACPLLEAKSQLLSIDVPERGMIVDADPDRLAQVFANLLTNAAKYSAPSTHVWLSASRNHETVVVRVKDQGLGIDPDMLESVFDQFNQQKQTIDRSQGGLGLGLAIVKNLVTMHGGTVRAISEGAGKGSELVVELPACAGDVGPDERAPSPVPRRGAATSADSASRVMVVDDNEDAAEMLAEALTGLGYIVRTAGDGPSALELAREFQPHIAVLDIGLPVMDGYELGGRLREAYGEAGMLLVALTGYGQASDKARSREAGFDAHLVKPIDLVKLHALLEDLLAAEAPCVA